MIYTLSEITTLVDTYTLNPSLETVNKLSVILNRPRRSIISKLVKEGVYQRKGYTTKYGKTPKTKLEVVRDIENILDIRLPDLEKSPKTTLHALHKSVLELDTTLEATLGDLANASGTVIATRDMLKIKNIRNKLELELKLSNLELDNLELDNLELANLELANLELDNLELDNLELDNLELDNLELAAEGGGL